FGGNEVVEIPGTARYDRCIALTEVAQDFPDLFGCVRSLEAHLHDRSTSKIDAVVETLREDSRHHQNARDDREGDEVLKLRNEIDIRVRRNDLKEFHIYTLSV